MMAPAYTSDLAGLLHNICLVPAALNTSVSGVKLDSRKVQKGDLFIALSGGQSKAEAYVGDALKNGANAVVVEGSQHGNKAYEEGGAVEIYVPDLKKWVGTIADRFYREPSRDLSVIGVTGTNGKTSVANYIASLFASNGIKAGVIGTLGYGLVNEPLSDTHYTTPDAVEVHKCLADLKAMGAQLVVMEVSSHGLEQQRVNAVRFEGAVFTNLTRDHLDYHGSMAEYALAKQKLFEVEGLSFAVMNMDDPCSEQFIGALAPNVDVIRYGSSESAEIYAKNIDFSRGIKADIETRKGEFKLNSSLLGNFNLSNLLAVIGVAEAKSLSADQLKKVNELKAVPGRMETLHAEGSSLVVIDYAHTPDALDNVLKALKSHCSGKLVTVFGCGGDRDVGKRAQMAEIAERHSDSIIVTDDNPRTESPKKIVDEILKGFDVPETVIVIHDRASAIEAALMMAAEDDVVLIAGKGHEDYQEIDGVRAPFNDMSVAKRVLKVFQKEAGDD